MKFKYIAFVAGLIWINCSVEVAKAQDGGMDYALGFGARSFPFGAAFYSDFGYSRLLWGDRKDGNYLYGFIRPAIRLQSSIFVNRAEASLDLYPVSFFGFNGGLSATTRNIDIYSGISCSSVDCMGTVYRKWARAKLIGGYRDFYVVGMGRYDDLRSSNGTRDFVDEYNVLVATATGDQVLSWDTAAGYKVSDKIQFGVHYSTASMMNSGMRNQMLDFYGGYKWSKWSILTGLGAYRSTVDQLSPTAYLVVSWTGIPWIGLD